MTHEVRMAAKLFDNRLSNEWAGFRVLRRVIIAVATVHFTLAAASGYRAIVQVYDVDIEPSSAALTSASTISVPIVTSGRTTITTTLELRQGSKTEVLGMVRTPSNESFFYDPRPHRGELVAHLPIDLASRFSPGTAYLRAVAEGQSQFVRVPPPFIREIKVQLAPTKPNP